MFGTASRADSATFSPSSKSNEEIMSTISSAVRPMGGTYVSPHEHDDEREFHHRPERARSIGGPRVRALPGGVRGRGGLPALAGQDRDRGRRPPVLPHHHEPPPPAHQRRLRGRQPAGPQRRG